MHYLELCINEAVHTANSDAPLFDMLASGSSSTLPGFERLECLRSSVNAIKSWIGAKLAPMGQEEAAWPWNGTANSVGLKMADQNHMEMMQSIDFGNDTWLEEFLAGLK